MVILLFFTGEIKNVIEFVNVYRLYLRTNMREALEADRIFKLQKKPKLYLLKSLTMDNFYFLFHFILLFFFIFCLFSIFRTKVRVKWRRSHYHMTGHIRWHGHKSHDAGKEVEGSRRMMSYNVLNTCWSYDIHMAV